MAALAAAHLCGADGQPLADRRRSSGGRRKGQPALPRLHQRFPTHFDGAENRHLWGKKEREAQRHAGQPGRRASRLVGLEWLAGWQGGRPSHSGFLSRQGHTCLKLGLDRPLHAAGAHVSHVGCMGAESGTKGWSQDEKQITDG